MENVDWSRVAAEAGLRGQLLEQATKRLKDAAAAERASERTLERLRAGDWQSVRQDYSGAPSPPLHLQAVALALLNDEVRSCADWPQIFFGGDLPERLTREARRRFGHSPDAESAYNFALDAISTDEWRKLQDGFRGTGSAEGFLRITFVNLLEEYRIRKYGKRRAPEWLRRLGWDRLYKMFCLQRLAPEEIVNIVCAREEQSAADVHAALAEIRARVRDCRQGRGEIAFAGPELAATRDAGETERPASKTLEAEDFDTLLQVLRIKLGAPAANGNTAALRKPLQFLDEALTLEDREILLLKLIYHEGLSIPNAARSMRPPLHEQTARRLHRALVGRIRQTLVAAGFDAATV